jgi:hypothetical protein
VAKEIEDSKWAWFRGYIVTANDDGSIPLNAQVVIDLSLTAPHHDAAAQRIVDIHNDLMERARG